MRRVIQTILSHKWVVFGTVVVFVIQSVFVSSFVYFTYHPEQKPSFFPKLAVDLETLVECNKNVKAGKSPYIPKGEYWTEYKPDQPYLNCRYDLSLIELYGLIPMNSSGYKAFQALSFVVLWLIYVSVCLLLVQVAIVSLKRKSAINYLPLLIGATPPIGATLFINTDVVMFAAVVVMLWATLREKPLVTVIALTAAVVIGTKEPQYMVLWIIPLGVLGIQPFLRMVFLTIAFYSLRFGLGCLFFPEGPVAGFEVNMDRFRFGREAFSHMPWGLVPHHEQENAILQVLLNWFGPVWWVPGLMATVTAITVVVPSVLLRKLTRQFRGKLLWILIGLLLYAIVNTSLPQIEYAAGVILIYFFLSLAGDYPRRLGRYLMLIYIVSQILILMYQPGMPAWLNVVNQPTVLFALLISVWQITEAILWMAKHTDQIESLA